MRIGTHEPRVGSGVRLALQGLLAALMIVLGCESDSSSKSSAEGAAATASGSTGAEGTAAATAAGGDTSASSEAGVSSGYEITVYYTAVESYHGGGTVNVRGCPTQDCEGGNDDLGTYPESFVQAVEDEGAGRITSGPHAGKYLNWSDGVGYWLDNVPANSYGAGLSPFRTAAADGGVLARGTRFQLVAPLIQDEGGPLDEASANRLLSATWEIQDEFTPGLGGAHHIDLYIGEEDRANFTETNPLYTTLVNASIRVQ